MRRAYSMASAERSCQSFVLPQFLQLGNIIPSIPVDRGEGEALPFTVP